jgi:hypothetical protein
VNVKADILEKCLDELKDKARESRDALDQLERRVSALPAVRTTTAEERKYLSERGWEFFQGKVWAAGQHGGAFVDGELATDRDRFDLGPFDSLEDAQQFCDKANTPGACHHCGESGPRDSLTIREFEARTRWMSDADLYEVAVRIWQNDWMATTGIHHPGRQCPPVPADVLALTKSSDQWWTADPKKDGKAFDVRKHQGTHLVRRCCECGRLPARFLAQAPTPPKAAEGVA